MADSSAGCYLYLFTPPKPSPAAPGPDQSLAFKVSEKGLCPQITQMNADEEFSFPYLRQSA
jgi:hypothetical protein